MDTSIRVFGFERFLARQGTPSVVRSDNSTNFGASDKTILHNVRKWNQQVLAESLVKKGIKLKFNAPTAPHHGGLWERLVRSFKYVFYAVLGNRRLTDEILATTFFLVEQSLKARPLVPASADATDLDALTPTHFLYGTLELKVQYCLRISKQTSFIASVTKSESFSYILCDQVLTYR